MRPVVAVLVLLVPALARAQTSVAVALSPACK
jgi:hypothetical protein